MKLKKPVLFGGLIGTLLLLFLLDLSIGSVDISLNDLIQILFYQQKEGVLDDIVLGYRLPKALTAILVGSALSVAGLMMQTMFRNPLAGPDVLGVNAGASLGVALITLFAGGMGGFLTGFGSWGLILAAIGGAVLVLLLVLLVSVKIPDLVSLLIVGIMFGYLASSIVSILQNTSNPDALKIFVVWTFGSLSAVSWTMFPILLGVVLIGFIWVLLLMKPLNAMLLGDNYAKSVGLSMRKIRIGIIGSTALLAGGVTAFVGPIGFIGITVPHIARGVFKSWDHRVVVPASMLCGAILMLFCDFIAQGPFFSNGLPINSVTALLGAPLIIWILLRNNK